MLFKELLHLFAENGVTLELVDDTIAVHAPEGLVTDEIKALIDKYQHELVERIEADAQTRILESRPPDPGGEPLSWFQERLWIHYLKNKDDLSYNIPIVFLVEGNLDVAALEKSLETIFHRHDSLRTRFATNRDGSTVQLIAPCRKLDLPVIAASEREINALVKAHAAHRFNLEDGPVFKVTLLRESQARHLLLINVHHIAADAWSVVGIFLQELHVCYRAFTSGSSPALPPLKVQYSDFARWQREQDFSQPLAYWQAHLLGYEDTLELPTDFMRHPQAGQSSEVISYRYSKAFSEALARFSNAHGCTLFISLLAGFALTIGRYTGRDDLCIGTTAAGRSLVELEPLIGFLVNILPLRFQIDEAWTVEAYMAYVRKRTLAGFDHQMVPFEMIRHAMETDQRGKKNALVPLVLRHQNVPRADIDALLPGGVTFKAYTGPDSDLPESPSGEQVAARCELEISYTGDGEGLEAEIVFASDMYERATIERLMGHHEQVLTSFFEGDQQRLRDISLLTEADRRRLCVAFNHTDATLAHPDRDFATRFEAVVERTPGSPACYDREGEWSYRDIEVQANRLAHALLQDGVGPGDVVGVCLERGAPVLIAILAIWKAGAAYVPLDPAYPASYLSQIIGDAAPQRVVGMTADLDKLNLDGDTGLALDQLTRILEKHPSTCPVAKRSAEALAYVMYTSGSTGAPKGVRVPHRQLINWLEGLTARWPFQPGEVVGQKTTIAFAVSVKELFAGLLSGCPQVFIPNDTVKDTGAFVDALARHRVSRLNIVPSHLRTVLAYLKSQGMTLPALKVCTTAGEPLTGEIVSELRALLPHTRLLNNYGCTELNDITYFDAAEYNDESGFVPIGRPIQNTKLYVLDREGRLVPEGVSGELHVSGLSMSDGYHNRPELTGSRYLSNPFDDHPLYARLYNTGDVVKYHSDGNLEFIGRWDFQVKVRGFRVDVRQVEKVLGDFPMMGPRAVVGDGERLLAFYVPKRGAALDLAALRAFLQKRLPSYMVPDAFVVLEAMPTLPNGKMNRRALLGSKYDLQLSDAYETPETELEERMANIWSEVLSVPIRKIGRNTHFFEIGGHSLAATRVVARLKDQLSVEVGLSQLFELPRLSQFCQLVAEKQESALGRGGDGAAFRLKISSPVAPLGQRGSLLSERVVLITGASRGIGQAAARLLAAHGARVAINYLSSEPHALAVKEAIEREGGQAEVFKADVTDPDAVRDLAEQVYRRFGRIDALVVNAAIGFKIQPFTEYEWGDFEAKVSGELKGVFYPCRAVVPHMVTRRSGSVVVLSSTLSRSAGRGYVAHSTAKAAVDAFVRSLATELGPEGVRVNAVAPGLVLTDATADLPHTQKEAAAQNCPLRRNGLPHDIAGAILFLISDLSSYMTGCYVPVDGGITML